LIRLKDVLHFVRVSPSTWWKWCAEGKAPQPVRLGERTTCWKAADIRTFIDNAGEGSEQ